MIKVVAAILEKDDKVLIAKKREGKPLAGLWEFPGGKIEEGERPEESVVRELWEEMSIKVKVNEYVGESIYDYGNGVHISLKGFKAEIAAGDIMLSDHVEYRWVTLQEINDYNLAPADIPLVEKLK